jgi:hypothetical protein
LYDLSYKLQIQNGSELHSSILPGLLQWWEKLLLLICGMGGVMCKSALLYTKSVSEACRCDDVRDLAREKSKVADASLLHHTPGPVATQQPVKCEL